MNDDSNESHWIMRKIYTDQAPFTSKNRAKQICWLTYSLDEALWIMDYNLKLKCLYDGFVSYKHFSLHKMLNDGLDLCELLEDYCDVFISCLDSHSDGTHSLQRIYWWASDVKLNFSKSVPTKKQTHLHLGWPESEYIFIFGWTFV